MQRIEGLAIQSFHYIHKHLVSVIFKIFSNIPRLQNISCDVIHTQVTYP